MFRSVLSAVPRRVEGGRGCGEAGGVEGQDVVRVQPGRRDGGQRVEVGAGQERVRRQGLLVLQI